MTNVLVCYAQAHGRTGGTAQEWVRNMLGCVGRGGNAQAIRDEILNIMHRHHIGEKRGTWMEVPSWTALTAIFVLALDTVRVFCIQQKGDITAAELRQRHR